MLEKEPEQVPYPLMMDGIRMTTMLLLPPEMVIKVVGCSVEIELDWIVYSRYDGMVLMKP